MAITGKLLADFSQFNTAVEKAEAELKGMQSEAGKVSASLNRMVDQFSGRKLVQEVTLAARAIKEVGGLSTLTGNEIKAFADKATDALSKLKASGQEIPAGLQNIAAAARQAADAMREVDKAAPKEAGGFFNDLTKQVASTAAGFISAQAIIGTAERAFDSLTGFVKDSIKSYANAEAAAKKMTTALQAQGTATPAVIRQFNDLASQFQRTTVYSDDLINEMEALLTQVGNVAPAQMEKALTAATNLASGLGIDLEQATTLVAKAFEGNTGALKRYGVVIDETKLKTDGVSAVLEGIQARFGGQAAAEVDTYAGHIKQLANDWDNLKEAVGKSIVQDPIIQAALKAISGLVKQIGDNAGDTIPVISEWWITMTGGQYSALIIKELNFILKKFHEFDDLKATALANPPTVHFYSIEDVDILGKLKVDFKAFVEQTIDGWNKADAAAKKYAESLKALHDDLSGAKLAADVKLLQDAVNSLGTAFTKLTPASIQTMRASDEYGDVLARVADKAEALYKQGARLTPQLMEIAVAFGRIGPKVEDGIKSFDGLGQSIAVTIPKIFTFTEVLKGADAEILKITQGLPTNFSSMFKIDPGFEKGAKKLIDEIHAANQATVDLGQEFQKLGGIVGGELGSIISDFGRLTESIGRAQQQIQHFRETGTHATTGQRIGAFVEGASDIIGATGSGSTLKRGIAGGIAGAQAGATIGAVFAPETLGLSIAVGAIAGGLVGIIRGKLAHDGRKAVEEFANSFQGGFDELHQRLHMLGDEGERLWKSLTQGVGRNNPEQAAQVINEITTRLGEADKQIQELSGHQNDQLSAMLQVAGTWQTLPESVAPYIDQLEQAGLLTQQNADLLRQFGTTGPDDFSRLKSEAEKFGVSLDALGPKFAQSEVTAKSTEIIQFFDEAIARGGDFNGILDGMKDEISDVVQQSLKFGTEIPGNMQPWIEQLAKSGQLLDENGRKITDTSKLKFGEKVSSSLDDVVGKLQEMIDLMTNGLPSAVGTVASSFDKNKGAFDSWRDHGVRAARDVADEVDRVSFGSSPGGLKEIPIQLGKATAALAPFSSAMTSTMSKAFVALTTVTDSLDTAAPSVDEATKHLQTMTAEMRKGSTASTFGAAFKGSVDATKESIDEARHSWEIMVAEMEQGGVGASVAASAKDDLDAMRKSADGTKASLKGFAGTILTTTATGAMTAAAAVKGALGGMKASADDTTKSLQTMTRAMSKSGPMTDMAAAFKGTLDGTKGSIATVGSALATNKNAWRDWQGLASVSAKAVQREVDAISFGRSPGGLKEIPLMLSRSVQALRVFSTAMSTTGIPRMLPTLSEPARVLRGPWPGSGAAGGKDGGTMATVNLHMDGQRFARTMVRAVPGVVKDYKLSH